MHIFKHTEGQLTLQNENLAKKQSLPSWFLLPTLLVLLMFAACDSNPARTPDTRAGTEQGVTSVTNGQQLSKVDSLRHRIIILEDSLSVADEVITDLRVQLANERKGSDSPSFLLGLLLLVGGVGLVYFFRNSIRRAYQRYNRIEHTPKPAARGQKVGESAPKVTSTSEKMATTIQEPVTAAPTTAIREQSAPAEPSTKPAEPVNPVVTAPPAPIAPAAAPEKAPETEITTDWEDVVPIPAPEAGAPVAPTIRYSYGAIDGTLQAFGEEDYDERTTFRIVVALDGQTATYTVVDNERQQRNVIENQASYIEAVEYRGGGEGHYANARIQPGTLQRAGDRWRIVDRLIINRV